jgi:predicted nucleotidyltransferase
VIELTVAQKRVEYGYLLDRALESVIEQIKAIPEVEIVYLFGSFASGRRDLFTDLDLIIILDTDQDYLSRIAWLYQILHTEVDMDLIAYTPKEFELLKDRGFLKHALKSARVIYETKSAR